MTFHYEVYADSIYGSKVLTFYSFEEAIKAAKEYQIRTTNKPLVIRVTEEVIDYV